MSHKFRVVSLRGNMAPRKTPPFFRKVWFIEICERVNSYYKESNLSTRNFRSSRLLLYKDSYLFIYSFILSFVVVRYSHYGDKGIFSIVKEQLIRGFSFRMWQPRFCIYRASNFLDLWDPAKNKLGSNT